MLFALVKDSEAFQQDSARGGENYETNVSPFASWEYVRTCYYDARKGDHRTQEGKGGLVGRNVKKGEVGRSVSTPDILQREVVHAIHIATPAMQNVYLYYYYYYYYIYIYYNYYYAIINSSFVLYL